LAGLATLQIALELTADSVRLRPGQPVTPGHYGFAALIGAFTLFLSALVMVGMCVGGHSAHQRLGEDDFVPETTVSDVETQTDPDHENKPKVDYAFHVFLGTVRSSTPFLQQNQLASTWNAQHETRFALSRRAARYSVPSVTC
jgi:hypothetical protein